MQAERKAPAPSRSPAEAEPVNQRAGADTPPPPRHRETNNNHPTPLPPSRAHRPRLIARRVRLARPCGVSRETFKPAQAIQPAGALSNLPARATSPPRTRPVPPGLSLTKDPIPPRAGLGRVGRVRERGRIRGDLRRVQRDQHGGRRRQSRRATASLARGSRAGQGPPGEPSESHVFDTSRPENAPALIVFSRPSSPAVADRTSPNLSRPVARRAQPPCRIS